MYSPEYFQGLWGDRNTANFDEQRLLATVKISQVSLCPYCKSQKKKEAQFCTILHKIFNKAMTRSLIKL
jgi:hypothetical protein